MTRLPAEWERQEYLLFALPHTDTDWAPYLSDILESYKVLIKTAASFQACLVLCQNREAAKAWYGTTYNVTFVEIPTDDTWIRDFGPIDIMIKQELIAHDFLFNAWGEKYGASKDNLVNELLYKEDILEGELKQVDLVLEGGSIDSNGEGVMLSTKSCLFNENRNPHVTHTVIEDTLKEIMCLSKIIWLEHGHLEGDDTDAHIDTLARFIDTNTIAYVACDDPTDSHYEALKKMEEELKETGYNLIPLPLPKPIYFDGKRLPATYANFIFVNDGIIVPTYNQPTDQAVLKTFQEAFPERKVVGVDATVFIRQNGSLHCATMNRFKGLR